MYGRGFGRTPFSRFESRTNPALAVRLATLAPIVQARRISRSLRNSFYVISRISSSNLATEVRAGSIDAEWTTEHTCFDRIPIERIARQNEALTGFHWDNPCR